MKVTIGLLIFVCITAITIHLPSVKDRRQDSLAVLSFAVLSGFVAANYEVIQRFKFGSEGVELETAKKEIGSAKSTALTEIKTEVTNQKESIRLLISTANETSEKLEDQRKALTKLIDTATALQQKIEDKRMKSPS